MRVAIALPLTALLLLRAYSHRSLTPLGLLTATVTALVHAAHPSPVPFTLLCLFFLAGTSATKLHHQHKARLTLSNTSATTNSDNNEPRTHRQVLANSGVASALVLLHLWRFRQTAGGGGRRGGFLDGETGTQCIPTTGSVSGLILAGIVANYAAVAADTLSSELGILSSKLPRLVTRPWVVVPRGTNGGVTGWGLLAGMGGAGVVALGSLLVMPFCWGEITGRLGPVGRVLMDGEDLSPYRGWTGWDRLGWVVLVTGWGALGSLLDSVLGALCQASVVDSRSGKVVEGTGGGRVLVSGNRNRNRRKEATGGEKEGRRVLVGRDWLDNNQVNLAMAAGMSLGGMVLASWWWGLPLQELWRRRDAVIA